MRKMFFSAAIFLAAFLCFAHGAPAQISPDTTTATDTATTTAPAPAPAPAPTPAPTPAPAPAPAPMPMQYEQIPRGFVIEGILPKQFSVNAMGYGIESFALPYGMVGFRLTRFTLGLGCSYFRYAYYQNAKEMDAKTRDATTTMLFPIRAEIAVFQSYRVAAEAYVTLGWGPGFVIWDYKYENGGTTERDEKNFAMGGFVGLGGRYFFGGGPFGIGVEFGWNGIFLHDTIEEPGDDTVEWNNFNNFYAALTGQFVFGR